MKKLLMLLDNLATAKLEILAERIIVKFKLEEKDNPASLYMEQPKLRTVHPTNRIPQEQWFKEYRVSCLHGKQITYF